MSWYSNIASRVNNSVSTLSRNLLNSEADGDTEDDTHVCRVLRQYYTEKNTGFPTWLPPDPKAPPPVIVQQPYQQQQQQQQQGGIPSRYGAAGGGIQTTQGASGLSSLWDKNRGAASAPPTGPRNPFAAGRSPVDAAGGAGGAGGPTRPPLPGSAVRNGSYSGAPAAPSSSIQDRLKGRLGGGARTVSPGNSGSGPFAPPAAQPPSRGGSGSGDYDPYRAGGGGGGGGLPSGPRRMGGLPSGPRMR
ncbi:unnamed protein product [Discula destructiva]